MARAMPWKECSVLDERIRFVTEWNSGDWNMAELCRFYGVTRKTGYKWTTRYEVGGAEALGDLSRLPKNRPNQISEEMEEKVMAVRREHPYWGARKIRAWLKRSDTEETWPVVSTIGEILRRNGLAVPRKRHRKGRPNSEPLADAERANRVWCTDYKGWFRTGDGERIDPLTITDAHSRYLIRCQAVTAADTDHSKPVYEAAFREYGLPERMRSDNGAPFGSNGDSGLTRLSVWWIKLGIKPERIEPGKPEQNGRHERMHRTLKQETATPPAANRRRQQERFDQFRQEYNEQRPHEALGQVPPATVYQTSPRSFPERLREPEYAGEWESRLVSPGGQFRWKGELVFAGHALTGERVGLEPLEDGNWRVWFSFYQVGVLESERGKIWTPERWEKRQRANEEGQ